jgi:MOSC domain-containing protein YiiM
MRANSPKLSTKPLFLLMPNLHPSVLSVNITSVVHEEEWAGVVGRTGIDKRSVNFPVFLANNCVAGDVVADTKNHGGYHKAVYAYSREDAQWWEAQLGLTIADGRFGENLTTRSIDVTRAVIGERWAIGSSVLEVAEPRIPCRVFAGFWDRPTLIKEFTIAGRPGAYLRIVEEGSVKAGDEIKILHRPSHGITISDVFAAKSGDRSRIAEIVEVPEISSEIREWAKKIIETAN